MAESNGSLKSANGFAHANGKANGKPLPRRTATKRKQGLMSWLFGALARLTTWTAILTLLFRCPNSLEECDENSPYICKPYIELKNTVSPHVQPYYDQHAAPYVKLARPYYEVVDSKVWAPARAYAVQYGAPWVEKGREQTWAQWEKNGRPQLVKFQSLAREKYDESVAPHVNQAGKIVAPYYEIARVKALNMYHEQLLPSYAAVQPYAVRGYDAVSDFTTTTALPTAYWAWNKTYVFLDTAVWPQLRVVYLENVEPQLHRIGERLGRYKNRENGKSGQESIWEGSPVDTTYSSFMKPTPLSASSAASVSAASSASSVSSSSSVVSEKATATKITDTKSKSKSKSKAKAKVPEPEPEEDEDEYLQPVRAPAADKNENEQRREARLMVTEDLKTWQNKFASQADQGAMEMEDRIDEIAKRMIRRNAKTTGRDLVKQLKSTIESELQSLKTKISGVVENSNDDVAKAEEDILAAIRGSGMAIKAKAQAIREWREDYDQDLQETVVQSADVHFKVLEETRNLALQQIGMRWAWTEGVTYKDWAKYHELKETLAQWTEQLKQLIITHPSLLEAQDTSAQVEEDGMEIASAAAKELAKLKEVAHWKLLARDATDNFESEAMQRAAEMAEAARIAKNIVVEEAEDAASVVSESVDEATASVASVVDVVGEQVKDYASSASTSSEVASSAISNSATSIEEEIKSKFTVASQSASSFLSAGSDEVQEATSSMPGAAEDAASSVSSLASDASEAASESLKTTSGQVNQEVSSASSDASNIVDEIVDEVVDAVVEAVSSATPADETMDSTSTAPLAAEASEELKSDGQSIPKPEAQVPILLMDDETLDIEADPLTEREETLREVPKPVKPAFLGAAAHEVPKRQVVLEDYVDTDIVASATDAAHAAYTNAVSRASEQYSSAASVISAQIYGTPKPVHDTLFAQVSEAYENAVAAANIKLGEAVSTAGLQATPTTTSPPSYVDWESVESIAAQRLDEGRLWAEIQYKSAMVALGLATETPSSSMEKYYDQAKFNYYAGLGLAQDRYASFMSGASSALSSLTATPTPTNIVGCASSVAWEAQESILSAAHAAGDAAGSAYSAAGEGVSSVVQNMDDSISSVVDAAGEQISGAAELIADSWGSAIAQISGQVYGEVSKIGWYDGMFNEAANTASAASDAASTSIATASAEAAKQYSAVNELVSELINGKEPSFTESVLSRLQAAYSTAAANVEYFASDASEAASSLGDKVGSAASQATEAVKESVQHKKDEL